jgi:hypothetical protein
MARSDSTAASLPAAYATQPQKLPPPEKLEMQTLPAANHGGGRQQNRGGEEGIQKKMGLYDYS